jgi:transposase-like protein
MTAPVVAVGDGALGFWAAAREVWPETREQACWCHKLGNVLDKLPQRLQPRAKRTLHEMMYAERRADCEAARARFEAEYQAKYPKAVESLTAHWERLITFFDFPAEHWKHLRTTNVIESPFAKGSRLIMTGRSTTLDDYSDLVRKWVLPLARSLPYIFAIPQLAAVYRAIVQHPSVTCRGDGE